MKNQSVLILGARSDMAQALAREYAAKGYNLQLAARSPESLESIQSDIAIRFQVSVTIHQFDTLDYDSHSVFYDTLEPKPCGVICAVGYLGEQKEAEKNQRETHKIIETNYTGPVSILNIIANDFEKEKADSSLVSVPSLVIGDAKATTFMARQRQDLAPTFPVYEIDFFASKVNVLTVKPGFVNTSMTKNLDLPKKLTAEPDEVAKDIYKAQQSRKDVLYTKWFWSPIMSIIKNIPEGIFKKTNI